MYEHAISVNVNMEVDAIIYIPNILAESKYIRIKIF